MTEVFDIEAAACLAQEAFLIARLVKSLSTMGVAIMTNPGTVSPASTVFVGGEDDTEKDAVRSLLAAVGWSDESVVDLGGIATAVGAEHHGVLFLGIMGAARTPALNIAIALS